MSGVLNLDVFYLASHDLVHYLGVLRVIESEESDILPLALVFLLSLLLEPCVTKGFERLSAYYFVYSVISWVPGKRSASPSLICLYRE
jgi:hypothetical protein